MGAKMSTGSNNQSGAQVALAAKAAALEAAKAKPALDVHGAHAPPSVRLLDKADVCAIANVSFPTIWAWMRAGRFPRSRVVGGKSMWLSTEVEQWLAKLPIRALKGDDKVEGVA
jgi:predicted DNA-binding transcriptional regulator AlpA